jgi:thymidylate synthase
MKLIESTTAEAYGEAVDHLRGREARPSRGGEMREDVGVVVRSADPRERHLFRDGYNLAFQLQEHWAYWAGANPGHVQRYNSNMETWIDDETGEMPGSAYGDRLRSTAGHDQVARALRQLREDPSTRRALMAVHQPAAEDYGSNDVACTAYLHPLLRDGELHMVAAVRSQDMYWGYPYDTCNNQYIQEAMAGLLGADVGEYVHVMDSCHYYTEHEDEALRAADEGAAHAAADCRLAKPAFEAAFGADTNGLDLARGGPVPAGTAVALDEAAAADGGARFYGDWFRVVAAYELSRHHDAKRGAVDRLLEGVRDGRWAEWARGWAR